MSTKTVISVDAAIREMRVQPFYTTRARAHNSFSDTFMNAQENTKSVLGAELFAMIFTDAG